MDLVPIRPEVIEARRSRHAGAMVLAPEAPLAAGAIYAAVVLVGFGALLGFGHYTSKVRVTGQLVPVGGTAKAVAPQFGRITARRVEEGASVRAGDVLFELTAERFASQGSVDARVGASFGQRREALWQRRDATRQQLAQRAGALADQQRMVEAQIASHRDAIALQDELIRSARANAARYRTLAQQGFVSKAQLDQTNYQLNVERAKRGTLDINLNNAQRTLSQVRQEAADQAAQRLIADGEARHNLAALDQEAAEQDGRSALRVTAPVSGRVTAMAYDVGQSVAAGTDLATVLPVGGALEAQLLVPSRAKPAVAVGQKVLLRLDAFPYQKYGQVAGTVRQVGSSPINDGPGNAGAVPLYRVTVALSVNAMTMYGKVTPFEAGTPLEADVFNDRRRLIEWLIDPLTSAAKGRTP